MKEQGQQTYLEVNHQWTFFQNSFHCIQWF